MADDGKTQTLTIDQAAQALANIDTNVARTFEAIALLEKQGTKGQSYDATGLLDKSRSDTINDLKNELNGQLKGEMHDIIVQNPNNKDVQDALKTLGGEDGLGARLHAAVNNAAPTLAKIDPNSTEPSQRMRAALSKIDPDALSTFNALVIAEGERQSGANDRSIMDLKARLGTEVNAAMIHNGNDPNVKDGVKALLGPDGLKAEQQAVVDIQKKGPQAAGNEFLQLMGKVITTVQGGVDVDPTLHQTPGSGGAKPQGPDGPQK